MEKAIWEEFEKLAVNCVNDLFCKNKTKISPTQYVKDNGYDATILSEVFQDDEMLSLLEAKLRNRNIGLRDIAATVIIGYNMGAYRIFFVINNFTTPQLNNEIERFQDKTNIKCKIVDRTIIDQWLNQNNNKDNYSKELIDYLGKHYPSKKEYTNKKSELKKVNSKRESISFDYKTPVNYFENPRLENIAHQIKTAISNGENVVVWGEEGSGKSCLINHSIREINNIHYIDLSNCPTTRNFVLKTLSSVWGLENYNPIFQFTDSEVKVLSSFVGDKNVDVKTREALKSVFSKDIGEFNQRADVYNVALLDYLNNLLKLHSNNKAIFYFYNLENATSDVLIFLRSFCVLLKNIGLQYIIEIRTPIAGNAYFSASKWEIQVDLFKSIDHDAQLCSVSVFTETEAIDFIIKRLPGLSESHAKIIINSVGTNPFFLSCAIDWLFNNNIVYQYPNNRVLVEKFKPFFESLCPEKNLVIAEKWVEAFLKESNEYANFLTALYILDGEMDFELFSELFNDDAIFDNIVENLEKNRIIKIENGRIVIMHNVYRSALENCCSSIRIRRISEIIIKLFASKKKKSEYEDIKIIELYFIRNEWEKVIVNYVKTINRLKTICQFRVAYETMKKVIVSYENIKENIYNQNESFYSGYLNALQTYLELSSYLKYIGQPSEKRIIDNYKQALKKHEIISVNNNSHYTYFYKYICSQYYHRNSDYIKAKEFCSVIKVKDRNKPEFSEKDIELIGKLCIGYALSIKATEGYNNAKNEFEELLSQYPESKTLNGEYLVHLSCMKLDSDPKKAIYYTKKVIELFENTDLTLEYPLFHKYGDLAMELFFSKDYKTARLEANNAINLAMANGIIAEEGRSQNILACSEYMLDKDIDNAIYLLKSSCFLLEKSYYIPYLWRSRINIATFYIKDKKYDEALSYILSVKKYLLEHKLSSVLNAIENKLFHSSREYIALLLVGKYLRKYYNSKYFDEIYAKINSKEYEDHVDGIVQDYYPEHVFGNSSFLHQNDIFIIG